MVGEVLPLLEKGLGALSPDHSPSCSTGRPAGTLYGTFDDFEVPRAPLRQSKQRSDLTILHGAGWRVAMDICAFNASPALPVRVSDPSSIDFAPMSNPEHENEPLGVLDPRDHPESPTRYRQNSPNRPPFSAWPIERASSSGATRSGRKRRMRSADCGPSLSSSRAAARSNSILHAVARIRSFNGIDPLRPSRQSSRRISRTHVSKLVEVIERPRGGELLARPARLGELGEPSLDLRRKANGKHGNPQLAIHVWHDAPGATRTQPAEPVQ